MRISPVDHRGRMTGLAIMASGLRKGYQDKIVLDGIDLNVRPPAAAGRLLGRADDRTGPAQSSHDVVDHLRLGDGRLVAEGPPRLNAGRQQRRATSRATGTPELARLLSRNEDKVTGLFYLIRFTARSDV